MVFKLQSGQNFVTQTATNKVERGVIQKMYSQELWFLRSVRSVMLVNNSMTFHEDILNGF